MSCYITYRGNYVCNKCYECSKIGLKFRILATKKSASISKEDVETHLKSVSADVALAQLSTISFKAKHDDLSSYYNYDGPEPPEIEVEKYNKTVAADNYMREGNFVEAIKTKCEISKICEKQEKYSDVVVLRKGIEECFGNVPLNKAKEGLETIKAYYPEMSKELAENYINA